MNKKYLQLFLSATIILFIYSLIHRIPDVDDGWLGELAYFQAKLGYVKSELMRGITMQEFRNICHHKFLSIQGGWLINVFGFSLYTLKSLSLMYLAIFILAFLLYAHQKAVSKENLLLFISLFFGNALIFEFSFIYRPEIPVMALGFLSYMCVEFSIDRSKTNYYIIILGGLFAGLAVATHLNGIVFPAAGFLLLLFNKKFKSAFVFGLATLPTMAIYFYDFRSLSDFKFWSYQMNNSPSIERLSDMPLVFKLLHNIRTEHLRFFHSPIEISFSVLMIIVFSFSYKSLKQYRSLIIYVAILIISITLFSVHKTSKYAIIYLPYLMLLVTYAIQFIYDKRNNITLFNKTLNRKVAINFCTMLLLFYFISNSIFNVMLCREKFSASQNSDLVAKYIPEKTSNLRIIAPMTFLFNEIDSFKSIQGEMYYTEMQKTDTSLYQKVFLETTKRFNIDYIILSAPHIELLGMNNCPASIYNAAGFEEVAKTDKLLIVKRMR